jgi:hypothetical protein
VCISAAEKLLENLRCKVVRTLAKAESGDIDRILAKKYFLVAKAKFVAEK